MSDFNLEKEAHKISREHCDMDEQEKMIISFGRRCQDEAYEKAAILATESWLEQRLIPGAEYPVEIYASSIQEVIRELKSTAGDIK